MLHGHHKYSEDLIVDISTPASYHVSSLEWVLETIKPEPRTILIEKPLVSDEDEERALNSLLSRSDAARYKDKIIVNESYYLSAALRFVIDDISSNGRQITEVHAELSKNRMHDVANGRFVDENLGSLGIELPHMVAMAQGLGFRLEDLSVKDVSVFSRQQLHNEGFRIKLQSARIPIVLESYLGDFRVHTDDTCLSNEKPTRTLTVATNYRKYKVHFDPVPGMDRYRAKICVYGSDGALLEAATVDDDHLANHLSKIHHNNKARHIDQLLEVENSLKITRYIIGLKSRATYKAVEMVELVA
jgi:predicted dehydrogenase